MNGCQAHYPWHDAYFAPCPAAALGLRGKRTVFGQQLSRLVIPGVVDLALPNAPQHNRGTTVRVHLDHP